MTIRQSATVITTIDGPVRIGRDGKVRTEDGEIITQVGITLRTPKKAKRKDQK